MLNPDCKYSVKTYRSTNDVSRNTITYQGDPTMKGRGHRIFTNSGFKGKGMIFALATVLFFAPGRLSALEDKKDEIPMGMEAIEVKPGMKRIVPKGTKVSKKGDLIVLEDINEYTARRLEEMEGRFKQIDFERDTHEKNLEERFVSLKAGQEAFKKDIEAGLTKVESNIEDSKRDTAGRLEIIESSQDTVQRVIDRFGLRQEEFRDEIERLKDALTEMRENIEESKIKK